MGTAQIKKLPVEHDVEDDDSLYPSRMPSSVRRYRPSQVLQTPQSVHPVQSQPATSSSARSAQSGRLKSSSKKPEPISEPDTYADADEDTDTDIQDEDEQEPVTQAPSVIRRRASLENDTRRATASMPAVPAVPAARVPTGNLPSNGARAAGATRIPTAPLKQSDPNAKANSEKAATTKIPSSTLSGRLPNTDALPRLGRKPIVALVIGMVAAILLVMVLGAFSSWWHVYQDDLHYGRPRTYQIDAVVGHGDSAANQTHFIFLNLHRHVEIIEIDGGDPAHTHIYVGPVLFGDGQDLTPITGEIRDVNHDGKPDLIVHIQNQEIIYINNGTIFVPQASNQ
ncbi:MAG TPA: hypothetical protein DHW02_12965 [Ktedonobacter sp.]|nr:hypothetical protein [Ktedonobacter sp.]